MSMTRRTDNAFTPIPTRKPVGSRLVTAGIILLAAITLGVTALLAIGRLALSDAVFFVAAPWALLAAVLRPDWLLVTLIAMPASFTSSIEAKRVTALIAFAIAALVVTRRRITLGLRTGLIALVIVCVTGYLVHAEVGQAAIGRNQDVMLSLTYYILLTVLALNLAVLGELDGERLGTALVVGVATTLLLALAGYGGAWFPTGPKIIFHTYLGWMAAAAVSVSLVRLLTAEVNKRLGHALVTGVLLSLTILSVIRAAWVAAAITVTVIAVRSGRRGYAFILLSVIVLTLLVPTVRQEVSRSESGDIVEQLRTGGITTGRWSLWTGLWHQAETALPWGNGFGHIWSLSSEDLFGVPGQFGSQESGFVPPHSDFMYLFVEFGIPGVVLLAFFWLRLFRARNLLTRSAEPQSRQSAWLLLGMLVTGLMVALVNDLLLVRPFAERFFPVAGFVFGLSLVERKRSRCDASYS